MSAVRPATEAAPEAISPLREAWIVYRRDRAAMFGAVLLLLIVCFVLYGSFFYGGDPYEIVWAPQTPPGTEAIVPLGTDYLGRDILRGLLKGGGPTLLVGTAAALISLFIGIFLGGVAGYFGGWIDDLLMRVTEFFQVLPALLFAMVVITLFSPSPVTSAIAIGVVLWPQTARLARAEFLQNPRTGIRHCGAFDRRAQRPRHVARDPAQRAAAADRLGDADGRRGDPLPGRPVVSRPR